MRTRLACLPLSCHEHEAVNCRLAGRRGSAVRVHLLALDGERFLEILAALFHDRRPGAGFKPRQRRATRHVRPSSGCWALLKRVLVNRGKNFWVGAYPGNDTSARPHKLAGCLLLLLETWYRSARSPAGCGGNRSSPACPASSRSAHTTPSRMRRSRTRSNGRRPRRKASSPVVASVGAGAAA